MKIVFGSLSLTIAGFLLNFVELSSQAENSPGRDGNSNENRPVVPLSPRGRAPSSSGRNPETDIDLNRPPIASPPRSRSASPDQRFASMILPSPEGHEYGIEQLRSIRLVSKWNGNRIFKLRTYTFPTNKALGILIDNVVFSPVPAGQHIVLSKLNGDVVAILESKDVFRGIFKLFGRSPKRVQLNVQGKDVKVIPFVPEESKEIPVGTFRPISKNYDVGLGH